jgi:hypothetical protein
MDDSWDSEVKASMAISLKRIADVLEAVTGGSVAGFANLEQLAWAMGRSFAQGQRTDR